MLDESLQKPKWRQLLLWRFGGADRRNTPFELLERRDDRDPDVLGLICVDPLLDSSSVR